MRVPVETISGWFDVGIANRAKFMLILYNDLTEHDEAVYIYSEERFWETYDRVAKDSNKSVMEIYDLNRNKENQFAERRALHPPARRPRHATT